MGLQFFRFQVWSDKQGNLRVRQECNRKPNYIGWSFRLIFFLAYFFHPSFHGCCFFFLPPFCLSWTNTWCSSDHSMSECYHHTRIGAMYVALFLWIINGDKAFQSIFFHYSFVSLPSHFFYVLVFPSSHFSSCWCGINVRFPNFTHSIAQVKLYTVITLSNYRYFFSPRFISVMHSLTLLTCFKFLFKFIFLREIY